MDDRGSPTRRDVLGAAGAGAAGAGWTAIAGSTGVEAAATDESGDPTSLAEIAAQAPEIGDGEPLTTVDLAALDNNIDRVVTEVQERDWDVRPALKSFKSPEFAAYVSSGCRNRAGWSSTSGLSLNWWRCFRRTRT
jgi:hypothetical protein